ncbi:hypothetical protein JOM56_012935 [Amanita muscaria]
MPSSSMTGVFPVYSPPNTEGRRTTFVIGLGGEEDNLREVTLWINNLSGMQMKAVEDHACYISGTLLIYNEGPEAIQVPYFMIEATTVEDLGISAEHMTPSGQSLANAHFVGQAPTAREYASPHFPYFLHYQFLTAFPQDEGQRIFEIRVHVDTDNRRFSNFRMPRVGGNVELQVKWIRDSQNPLRSHWLLEHLTFLGSLANAMPQGPAPPQSPNRRRLFGASKTAGSSKRRLSSSPDAPIKKIKEEPAGEAGPSMTQPTQRTEETGESGISIIHPVSGTSSSTLREEEEEGDQLGDLKGKGKGKARGKK